MVKQPHVSILTVFIFLLLFGCLFGSCAPGDRFKQHHLEVIENILKIFSIKKTHVMELFDEMTTEVEAPDGNLQSIAGQWEGLYHYLELLNAEIDAHKQHLYGNDETRNLITTIVTANGELLTFALVNYTEVEGYDRMQNQSKLLEVLSAIEDNTLHQLNLIRESLETYHDSISNQ